MNDRAILEAVAVYHANTTPDALRAKPCAKARVGAAPNPLTKFYGAPRWLCSMRSMRSKRGTGRNRPLAISKQTTVERSDSGAGRLDSSAPAMSGAETPTRCITPATVGCSRL
jgi:hypothetical protein